MRVQIMFFNPITPDRERSIAKPTRCDLGGCRLIDVLS